MAIPLPAKNKVLRFGSFVSAEAVAASASALAFAFAAAVFEATSLFMKIDPCMALERRMTGAAVTRHTFYQL